MKRLSFSLVLLFMLTWISSIKAQVITFSREEMIKYTKKNPYDRFPDGRPKVPDQILDKAQELSSEEAWHVLLAESFTQQFESGFQMLHPGKKLVGRAVTAQFMPTRRAFQM